MRPCYDREQPYAWCEHTEGKSWCKTCSDENYRLEQESRKAHGESCGCSSCDWDDYWKHLGKQ